MESEGVEDLVPIWVLRFGDGNPPSLGGLNSTGCSVHGSGWLWN